MEKKFEIREENGKCGIVNAATEQVIVPFEYEEIYQLSGSNEPPVPFILLASGKMWGVYVNSDNTYDRIPSEAFSCEYGL